MQQHETYGLTWPGKRGAAMAAHRPPSVALVPDAARSVRPSPASDIFIEGDNLDVLKLLRDGCVDAEVAGRVALIYIDPPYNTGGAFVYDDDFRESRREHGARTGGDEAGHQHSRWLSFVFPRLKVARDLLRPDGVIMIHIDEHEVARLSLVMEEIFGDENNLGEIVWDKRNPKGDADGISRQHEHILCFARSREALLAGTGLRRRKSAAAEMLAMAGALWADVGTTRVPADLRAALRRHGIAPSVLAGHEVEVTPASARAQYARWLRDQPFTGGERAYCRIDDDGEVYRLVSMAWPSKKPAPAEYFTPLVHPVTGGECPVPARGWRNPPATMAKLLAAGQIVFGPDETTQPQRKYLLRDHMHTNVASVLAHGGSDDALLAELGIPFETPKPVALVRELVAASTEGDDIVLDFFAGSGTTAHAVALQNASDGGQRRCISVNIAEPTPARSAARRQGFETVSQITLARLQVIMETVDGAAARGLRCYMTVASASGAAGDV